MVEIFKGPVNVEHVFSLWHGAMHRSNQGAFVTFVGIVRDEDGIEGLSFDIYQPLLESWFKSWQHKAEAAGARVIMAHSVGDVPLHKSSFVCAVASAKRRAALELIDAFVEDFKANAPIWKYDIKGGTRHYAASRSTPLDGAGLLS